MLNGLKGVNIQINHPSGVDKGNCKGKSSQGKREGQKAGVMGSRRLTPAEDHDADLGWCCSRWRRTAGGACGERGGGEGGADGRGRVCLTLG